MAKRRGETYAAKPDFTPRCVIEGCEAPIKAEIHDSWYGRGAAEFFSSRRSKNRARQLGERRIYVCAYHLEHDPRMGLFRWQEWFAFDEGGL